MYCITCHHINHNVKTCRSKKEELIVVVTRATTQASKPPKLLNDLNHICGIMDHKLTNYQRFGEMQSIFKDKGSQSIESKLAIKLKTIIASINMVDVNVTTHSKTNEKQVFKD